MMIQNGTPGTDPRYVPLIFKEPNTVTQYTQSYLKTIALYLTNILLAHFSNNFGCTERFNS